MTEHRTFRCTTCGAEFSVAERALAKYPGWTPKFCNACRDVQKKSTTPFRGKAASARPASRKKSSRRPSASVELNLSRAEVLSRFHDGPKSGIFTDGSAMPNPGPGGWGAVDVQYDQVVKELYGHEAHTTNNRMELSALIQAYSLVAPGVEVEVFTDSQLCVKIVTQWAAGWKARGWTKKGGEIKNLDLVKTLYALHLERPELKLNWIKAHDGSRWNEYADSLATAYSRDVV